MKTSILWRRLDIPGYEACRVTAAAESWRVAGSAVFAWDGRACRLDYSILCDSAWHTRSAGVSGWIGDDDVSIAIAVGSDRRWTLNGTACEQVSGCVDIDLNFSPSTNLLPIRRLALDVGQSADVQAAWLRCPNFALERLPQRYTRLDRTQYRYESAGGEFAADLIVNDAGLVTSYEGLWVEAGVRSA